MGEGYYWRLGSIAQGHVGVVTATATQHEEAVRPPVVILSALLLAALLELLWPLGPGLAEGRPRPVLIGLGIAVIGAILFDRAHRQFARAGTPVSPRQAATVLVTDGLYAVTRNPVYIALVTVYFGLVVALTTVWGLVLMPLVVAVLHRAAVLPEERRLAARFGAAYRAYADKVPRWL